MVVPEVPESFSLKRKATPKPQSNNSTAWNSADDTLTSAKIVTPVPRVSNTEGMAAAAEGVSECVGLPTEVEDMDSEGDTAVVGLEGEVTDEEGMLEEDIAVEDMVVEGMEGMDREGGWEEEKDIVNLTLLMILRIMLLRVGNLPTRFMCRMYLPLFI